MKRSCGSFIFYKCWLGGGLLLLSRFFRLANRLCRPGWARNSSGYPSGWSIPPGTALIATHLRSGPGCASCPSIRSFHNLSWFGNFSRMRIRMLKGHHTLLSILRRRCSLFVGCPPNGRKIILEAGLPRLLGMFGVDRMWILIVYPVFLPLVFSTTIRHLFPIGIHQHFLQASADVSIRFR